MRLEGQDLKQGRDERFEAVSWNTSSVESLQICGEEESVEICGEEESVDVLEDIYYWEVLRIR